MVVLFLIVALLGFIFWSISAQEKARERRFAEQMGLAERLGFVFFPEGGEERPTTGLLDLISKIFEPSADAVFLERFPDFAPFGQGFGPDITNLLVGTRDGIDWYVFDYTYKTQHYNGKTTTTVVHPFGVVAARIPLLLPPLTLAPETFMHKVGSQFGLSELTFEYEEFNRRYFVQSTDAKASYDVLHGRAIQYLMHLPIRHWQMSGTTLLIYQKGFFETGELEGVMGEIEGFVDLVPAYYREDRGFRPTWSNALD